MLTMARSYNGPSPRVWGIQRAGFAGERSGRSIPTRVGNTHIHLLITEQYMVHPHACGEYLLLLGYRLLPGGPSPRVWGIHERRESRIIIFWSIPTRVGNTVGDVGSSCKLMVHPHACGEYVSRVSVHNPLIGPSPRVWGIHQLTHNLIRRIRSIPTRVGNTLNPQPPHDKTPVHPHACGEYLPILSQFSPDGGPSPRVWGIQYWLVCMCHL